ncbi:MAG: hypothetical protein HY704_14330 [Gemmatimonadetes bacterium]|nr:hypothetical protein [Gemmatimonadota bacterium]
MSAYGDDGALQTLEPLVEAVQRGIEEEGWRLSGIQKTTSYEFEGRWAGESTRSAYLFFHRAGVPEGWSVDAFLDETSGGLSGNLALVVDGPDLDEILDVRGLLVTLQAGAALALPAAQRESLAVRFLVADVRSGAKKVESELRFKVELPNSAVVAGASVVSAVCRAVIRAYEALLKDGRVAAWVR